MDAKYTPGPWTWGENFRGLYGEGPDNEILTYEPYEGMWLTYCNAREANARLIAAAPDLLEALRDVLRVVDCVVVEFDVARAAIAKAEGK
jgi:hypothetical protein